MFGRAPQMSEAESSPMRVLLCATLTYRQQETKRPVHVNQLGKLLGASPLLLQLPLFLKNSNIETNTVHSKLKKNVWLHKPDVFTSPIT